MWPGDPGRVNKAGQSSVSWLEWAAMAGLWQLSPFSGSRVSLRFQASLTCDPD